METISVISDLANFGAAGVMGAMWLWERRASTVRERQLTDAHDRIMRDEQRLSNLTRVVTQNTAALERFHETQREVSDAMKHLLEEIHHEKASS